MKKQLKRSILFVCLFLIPVLCSAARKIDVPTMNGPVNDNANVISSSDEAKLNTYLSNLNTNTSIQIAVLTINSLKGHSIEDYSMAVVENWKLGQKGKDNGVLLLVSVNDRELRIETGYGLEGDLTDAKCGLIIRSLITPYFKGGNYSKGILTGVQAIAQTVAGDAAGNIEGIKTVQRNQTQSDEDSVDSIAGLIFGFIFFIVMISAVGSRRRRYGGRYYGRRRGGFLETLFWLNILGNAGRHHGGNDIFKNDNFKGGFGGFGGGGFSGGGGGFGGGGASGSW